MGELLKQRRAELLEETKAARAFLEELTDEKSFVELDAYRFSTAPLFGEAALKGEGVLTGYARIDDMPVYVAVYNHSQIKGGLTAEQSRKIVKAMTMAQKSECPFVFVLESSGVKVGEGLPAVDAFCEVVAKASQLYGVIPMVAVVKGEVLGLAAYLAAQMNAVIAVEGAVMASNSPDVILSQSGSSLTKAQAFGAKALFENGSVDLVAKDASEARTAVSAILGLMSGAIVEEEEASLNRAVSLEGYTSDAIISEVFDAGSTVELGNGKGLRTVIGRIGGFAVGAVLSNGERICAKCAGRAARFIRLLEAYELPLITFTDCKGAKLSLEAEANGMVAEISALMSAIADHETAKISVTCDKAQGVGYAALSSKGLGYDYAMAWDTAALSLLTGEQGAVLLCGEEIAKAKDPLKARAEAAEKYSEIEGDPFAAAYKGCVDAVIEPEATRRQIIAVLMMLFV